MQKTKLFSAARLLAAAVIGLAVTVCISSFSVFASDCAEIRESVLRLHILANSDSEEDQALKLAVRDRILSIDNKLFGNAENLEAAEQAAVRRLTLLRETALDEIRRQGYDYDVKVELANMYFTTREYEKYTLPAGYYDAVRITIGEGKGHNWWCVLYPPLCLPAAESDTKIDDVLDDDEVKIVEGKTKYKYSFAAVEIVEGIKNYLFDEK